MSDCENFKSPQALGLKICTSDITCVNGLNFECINLPSNPDLNDVLNSIDDSVCELFGLVNNITVPSPTPDPWLKYQAVDVTSNSITPFPDFPDSGIATVDLGSGIIPVSDIAYNVISENTVQIKGWVEFKIDLDTVPVNWNGGNFIVSLDFPSFSATGSNVLSVDKVMEPIITQFHSPCRNLIQQQSPVLSNIFDAGAGAVTFSNDGAGGNRITIKLNAAFETYLPAATGRWNIRLGFDGSAKLVNA